MGDVGAALTSFIKEEFIEDGTEVEDTTNLLEEEIIDSLGIFTLVSFIEEKFGVKVDEEEVNLENFQTVASIEAMVDKKLP